VITYDLLEKEIDKEISAVIVCLEDTTLIGVAEITFKKYVAILSDFYVSPHRRNQGIGKEIIEMAVRLTKNKGKVGLELTVISSNYGARKLYEKVGFGIVNDFSDGDIAMFKKV
jgi:ribosomal protein S18 acetylase RimI-like enzyme